MAANEARASLRRGRRRQQTESLVGQNAEGRTTDRGVAMLDVAIAVSRLRASGTYGERSKGQASANIQRLRKDLADE